MDINCDYDEEDDGDDNDDKDDTDDDNDDKVGDDDYVSLERIQQASSNYDW